MQNSVEQVIDEILVMDAQNGRGAAFEALVSRWQKRLWWHAYHLTGQSEAAWDITQEGWLSIVRGLRRLHDPTRFGAWAYRIVSNKAHDWRCRNHCESSPESELDDLPVASAAQKQREMASDVHGILRHLTSRSQVVLKLHYLEGFGLGEIAHILGMPEGTVKSRLYAARAEFRKHWEALSGTPPTPLPATREE